MASNINSTILPGPITNGSIDWTKLSVTNGGLVGHTIAAANTGAVANIKPQKFEDRPTLFGEVLRITWRITEHELTSVRDGDELINRVAHIHNRKLELYVKATCPDCHGCAHARVVAQEQYEPLRATQSYSLTASCQKRDAVVAQCPNGKFAVRKGHTAMVPNVAEISEAPIKEVPAGTEVHIRKPQPYISSQERDKPTSAAPDAW